MAAVTDLDRDHDDVRTPRAWSFPARRRVQHARTWALGVCSLPPAHRACAYTSTAGDHGGARRVGAVCGRLDLPGAPLAATTAAAPCVREHGDAVRVAACTTPAVFRLHSRVLYPRVGGSTRCHAAGTARWRPRRNIQRGQLHRTLEVLSNCARQTAHRRLSVAGVAKADCRNAAGRVPRCAHY